jgi:acetolactate synthase-1/2/3 large subunit
LKGFELFARSLEQAGVEFCVLAQESGLGLENLSRALSEKGIEVLSPISETSAPMIADGYARASGKPAVVISSGDILKLIAGATSAWADKSPLILVSICPDDPARNSPVFDRELVDLKQVFKPITRFQARAKSAREIPELLIRCFREAISFRGGPVFLEIPALVLEEEFGPREEWLSRIEDRLQNAHAPTRSTGDPVRIQEAVEMLRGAARPMIFSGGGVIRSGASHELNQLAELMGIPITSSMGGMGSALPDNPCYIGPPSYLSGEAFHTAIKAADVVLAVGCVFSGLDGFGLPPIWSSKIRFIQINVDPEDIAYNPRAALSIVGDARLILAQMIKLASGFQVPSPRRDWVEKLKTLNQEHRQRVIAESSRPWKRIHPATLALEMHRIIEGDTDFYAVLDGGNTCLWAGMLIDLPGPGHGFFPTGMGTLGSGIPIAMGVKKAVGDKRVFLINGDGSFLYNIQELETLRRYNIPLIIIIFNDSAWNMIRSGQVSFTGAVYGTDIPQTDYANVARSFGCFSAKVRRKEEIEPTFKQALESGMPAVIDVEIDPDSMPDSLISFARVEFEGAKMSPAGMLRSILSGKMNLDLRLLNQVRYIRKTF